MNKQEIFDKSYLSILAQGEPAMGLGNACMYETRKGNRCGVGMLIESKELRAELDALLEPAIGGVIRGIQEGSLEIELPDWMFNEEDLLDAVQNAHDSAATGSATQTFIAEYKARMATVAKNFALTVPEVK